MSRELSIAFGRSWLEAEWSQIRAGRWRRPLGYLLAAVILEGALLVLVSVSILSNPVLQLLSAGVAVVMPAAVVIGIVHGEARAFRHATRAWFEQNADSRSGAYISLDRRGRWWLYCVHAVPTGQGHGSSLMSRICATADAAGRDLYLKSNTPASTVFYQRHGFTTTRGRVMFRPHTAG